MAVTLPYSVGPHPVSSLHIYTFVVSRAFMAGAASQAGDADSSRAPGLTSALQGSVNVHSGALLLVPQWQCISSFCIFHINLSQTYTCATFTQRDMIAWLCLREKGRDLTQSCDKNPYTHRTIQKATWQHKNATKNFDYTTIADRLRTVSLIHVLYIYLSKFLSYHLISWTGSAFAVYNIGK